MRDTSQLSMVFVGCGGTFFMGMPYFKVLVQWYKPQCVHFIDPDKVVGKNLDRQWPYKDLRGAWKASLAAMEFQSSDLYVWDETFGDWLRASPYADMLWDFLVVVNVDNDAARLEVREWARNRKGWTGMVVSGCEVDYGQAYWGAWQDGEALHDWWRLHQDVGLREKEIGHRCAPQTAEANALTGVLAGLALKDLLDVHRFVLLTEDYPSMVREYYWERTPPPLSLVKSWTLEVRRQGDER